MLNASARKSMRKRSFTENVFAMLKFSLRPGNTRTPGFRRGALPSTPTGWVGNALLARYRSLLGSNELPAMGARQSYVVTHGRFAPLKIGSDAFDVTPIGVPEL